MVCAITFIELGPHSISLDRERLDDRDVLHKIVESEAYSDDEFTEAVTKLGKNWYIPTVHVSGTDFQAMNTVLLTVVVTLHQQH